MGSDDRIAGCSTRHGKERRIDGASGFHPFLVFQDENCLPTSRSVCGGAEAGGTGAGPGAGFGSPRIRPGGPSAPAEPKRTNDPGETKPQPQTCRSLPHPHPAVPRFSTHPFCRIIFFHRSSVRSEAIWGGGGGGRGGAAGTAPAIGAAVAPRGSGPAPVTRRSEPSAAPPPPRPPPPAPSRSSGGCAGLPSSIYSRAPVTSGLAARGEAQPTEGFSSLSLTHRGRGAASPRARVTGHRETSEERGKRPGGTGRGCLP